MMPPGEPPAGEQVDLSESRDEIHAKVIENILGKLAGGGVPTDREMKILSAATTGRGQGRPTNAIRWTIEHAATEFDLDRKTLTKGLRAGGIEPGPDGKYSTRDICRAVFGANPRDEKDREQAENFRIKNQELRKERVPIEDVRAVWDSSLQGVAVALKMAKGKVLTEEIINEIFAQAREAKTPC